MAHDFSIEKVGDQLTDRAYFFGFAQGLMYQAFDCWSYYKGISGSGESKTITYNEFVVGVAKAIKLWNLIDYPDPNRLDNFIKFYEKHKNDPKDSEYIITFS